MQQQLPTLNMNLPIGNLDAYISRVNQIPMLTADEERHLAEQLTENNDLEAARAMILSHLRFVVSVARGYMGYGLALADLIQEGNVGLMKAVRRFDPKVGVRLVSFAVHWIKAEIHEFILKNWRIVKVATTKAQRKLFFNLRGMKKRLGWFSKAEVDEVATALGVTAKEVELMEQRLNAYDDTFDAPSNDDEDAAYYRAPANVLEAQNSDPALLVEQSMREESDKEHLLMAFTQLDDRSKDILESRWFAEKKATLHELAAKYEVSAERVRQLEQNAMKKLKKHIEASRA